MDIFDNYHESFGNEIIALNSAFKALPQEYRLLATLIRDSILNIEMRNVYWVDSFLFLVDSEGELSYWLDCLPDGVARDIRKMIYDYLESKPEFFM